MPTDFQLLAAALVCVVLVQCWQAIALYRLRVRVERLEHDIWNYDDGHDHDFDYQDKKPVEGRWAG